MFYFESLFSSIAPPKIAAKIIISPHAGYRYSGQTTAHAFNALREHNWKRIIILGPSHHAYLEDGWAISGFDSVATPLGDISVFNSLRGLPILNAAMDIKEHSLEMQFPFIRYLFPEAEIIPVLIGSSVSDLSGLTSLLIDPDCAMVVSSDFSHVGPNYGYTPRLAEYRGSIEFMDKAAFECIESGNPETLRSYLMLTGNTICGKYPILTVMNMVRELHLGGSWKMLDYSRSSLTASSSVGYMACACHL